MDFGILTVFKLWSVKMRYIRVPSNFFIVTVTVFIMITFGFQVESLGMANNREPTSIVVDSDTGKPIEGAVALAIWRKKSVKERAWFEGGTMIPVRIEEVLSDKEGHIYIDGFWGWHMFKTYYPRLTIYKPGYICWDQKSIYINETKTDKRNDFTKESRIVRMKKVSKKFSYIEHERFISSVTINEYYKTPNKVFDSAFEYERKFRIIERKKNRNNKKE